MQPAEERSSTAESGTESGPQSGPGSLEDRDRLVKSLELLIGNQRYAEAENFIRQFLDFFPEDPELTLRFGICRLHTDKPDDAMLFFGKAKELGHPAAGFWQAFTQRFGKLSAELRHAQLHIERLRRSHFMQYPTEVAFESMTLCNAACQFCPYPGLERKGEKMSDALIDKLIEDLKEIPDSIPFTISPFKVNDPFLDKRIFDICSKINRELPHARIRLFTNGTPLTEANLRKVVPIENLHHLWISLNHHVKEAYEPLMGLSYDKIRAKLDMVHKAVEDGWFPHEVVISRVGDRTADDMAFVKFLQETYPRFKPWIIGRGDWVGDIDTGEAMTPPIGCTRWFELSVMATGEVALCCMDGEGKHVIGDIREQSVLDIYNAAGFRALREKTATRLEAGSPCDTCVYG